MIRVYSLFISFSTNPQGAQFKSSNTALTGIMGFNVGTHYLWEYSGEPWFVTSAGGDFRLNQSASVTIGGRAGYIQS